MKSKSLLLLLVVLAINSGAQTVQINEGFTIPFNPSVSGWYEQNNSVPIGSIGWYQGQSTTFPSFNGAPSDYYAVDNGSQGSTPGGISNFLVTPTVSLCNGSVFKFRTRCISSPQNFPDRLQVLLSKTASYSCGTGTASVGTFTTLLFDINPSLSSTGYPAVWTQYSATLTGITGTISGAFAFRYFVNDGGSSGSNSDYIGIDDVVYTTTLNCIPPTISLSANSTSLCGSGNVNLIASGASSYTWSTGSIGSSTTVPVATTTVFSVVGSNTPGCNGSAQVTISVVQIPTLTASNVTACPGQVTLTASGATSYSWSNGGSGSSIVANVSGNTVFTVTGYNAPNCSSSKTLAVFANTFMTTVPDQTAACPGSPLTIGASGANTYSWNTGATTPSIIVTPTANGSYTVTGSNGTCNEMRVISVTITPNLFAPNFTTCAGTSATLLATGAQTYSWSTGATTSLVVVSPSANSVYTITGTSGACSVTRTVSVTLSNKLSVNCTQNCVGSSLFLSAYGASSYTWYPINNFNQSVIVVPTGPTIYTLSGTSGTCSGTQTIQVMWCSGVEELSLLDDEPVIYPNPFTNELNFKNASGEFKLMNIHGQLVLSGNIEGTSAINTESLPSGIYFIVVTNNTTGKRKMVKVIKE